jgi:hypothetical protein
MSSLQDLRDVCHRNAPTRVEGDLLAHVPAGIRGAEIAHHVDEIDEIV